MKQKKVFGVLTALVIILSMPSFPKGRLSAKAVTTSEVTSRVLELIDEYVGTQWNDDYYGIQCKGFANLMYYKIFGVTNIGVYDSQKYYIPNASESIEIGRLDFDQMSEEAARDLLLEGYCGDFIQVRRRGKSWGHSMILVGADESGISVFDCNSDGNNTVKHYYISFADFFDKNSAMSLYRYENYESDSPETVNHTPVGAVDVISSPSPGYIRVQGWAYDEDDLDKSLEVHVYVGGPANGGQAGEGHCYVINANEACPDLNKNGIRGNHRFDTLIRVDETGNQEVYVYAINIGSGNTNPFIKSGTVNIAAATSYKAVFDANGGKLANNKTVESPDASSPQLEYGSGNYYSISWLNPTRTGYTFTGWYTAKSGGTKIYGADGKCVNDGKYWSNYTYCNHGDMTVYAQWTANEYTLTYEPNGGTVSPTSDKIKQDSAYSLPTPTRTGYTFTGWYTAKSGGTKINSGSKFTAGANQTLYAQWTEVISPFEGSGTKDDPYLITSKEDLEKMRDLVNDNAMTSAFGSSYYLQTADIDLNNEKWTPIGKNFKDGVQGALPNFKGFYNGNYHSIKGLYVSESDKFAGLFGSINNKGIVENLEVYGTVLSESNSVGGIAGEISDATIRNCGFYGDIQTSDGEAGGVLGYLWQCGTVENCFHQGTVKNSNKVAGGLIGSIQTGKSDDNACVNNCYHSGKVEGASGMFGSLVGRIAHGGDMKGRTVINNCYVLKSDADVSYNSGAEAKIDISPLTENQLKASAEDLGKSFAAGLKGGYPVLRIRGDVNADRIFSVADVVLLEKWLLNGSAQISDQIAADICEDNRLDVFDMIAARKLLLQ